MSPHNRREHTRIKLALSAEITADGNVFTASTRDLSAGGCCLEGAYQLDEGSLVDVNLFLVVDGIEDASTPPLSVQASVQWTADNDDAPRDSRHICGMKFISITPEQKVWLAGVLAKAEAS